jgi:hypothetical protein
MTKILKVNVLAPLCFVVLGAIFWCLSTICTNYFNEIYLREQDKRKHTELVEDRESPFGFEDGSMSGNPYYDRDQPHLQVNR